MNRRALPWVRVGLAAGFLCVLLILPNRWGAQGLPPFPLEWPLIVGALMLLANGRTSRAIRVVVAVVLSVLTVLKLADMASFASLGRPFNPAADGPLAVSAFQLLRTTIGLAATLAWAVVAIALLAVTLWLLWRALGVLAAIKPTGRARHAIAAVAVAALFVAVFDTPAITRMSGFDPPGAASNLQLAADRVALAGRTFERRQDYARIAREDPFDRAPVTFSMIDRDVVVLFVESYGRASFDNPLYAPSHLATLERAEAALADAGLAARSGFVVSPTRGGQSWLAHLTFAAGLWVEDQLAYQAVLQSGRKTLFHFAAEAGLHTVAVMPAITLPWPEAKSIGFEAVLAARDLGYRGQPFDWVTMPDQFTLSRVEKLLAAQSDRSRLIEAALISSHAPWAPLPHRVPWDEIGDGAVFDGTRREGAPPSEVWRDRDRVRDQYRKALDYALATVFEFTVRQADAAPLIIVLGDHQATSWIAGSDNAEVPVHVIGPPELVEPLEGWGWSPGLIPDAAGEAFGMDEMRDRLLRLFGARSSTAPLATGFGEAPLSERTVATRFDPAPEVLQ